MKLVVMRTFREYHLELTSLEKSVAEKKKSIQEKNERRSGRLDGKYARFLRNSFIIGEDEQVKYRELMESGLSKKKQQLEEKERKDFEVQDRKIDSFKNMDNGREYRVYELLRGIIDDDEEEKKRCEKEISVIQTMIEQLKKELSLKKSEQQILSQRKSVLELLDMEVGALNENRAKYKSQIYEGLEDVLVKEKENALQQVDISTIQGRIEWLSKKIPWLEKQLHSRRSDYKQILKELNGIISENPEKEKEMGEALKYAEIGMLVRRLKEPLQDLMDKYGVGQEFLGNLCRYLRKEWKISRGMVFLMNGEENAKLQISEKHIGQWANKYGANFIQDLVQLLCKEGIEVIQEELEHEEDGEEVQEFEITDKPTSSEENEKRSIIKMLENSKSVSDSVSTLRYLGFRFQNEDAFINQVKEAESEGLQGVAENINRWIIKYMIGAGTIDYKRGKKGESWYRIALSCNGRNPRILLKKDEKGNYIVVCIAPHDDYENILQGQTKNYFQTWKGNWMERGERGGKKGRA